jgi:hypothetical protein
MIAEVRDAMILGKFLKIAINHFSFDEGHLMVNQPRHKIVGSSHIPKSSLGINIISTHSIRRSPSRGSRNIIS